MIPARDFTSKLSTADRESLPSTMREGVVMWFTTSRELDEVKFIYSLHPPYNGTAPILVLDAKLQVLWMARYTVSSRGIESAERAQGHQGRRQLYWWAC